MGRNIKHGMHGKRLYNIWINIKNRVQSDDPSHYKWYKAKGIQVCEEWKSSFETFMEWALANGYNDSLTIERKDSNGNYEPSNCEWITRSENSIRGTKGIKGRGKKVRFRGKYKTLKEWAEDFDIDYITLYQRINRGWSIEKALTEPVNENVGRNSQNRLDYQGRSLTLTEWAAETGIAYMTLYQRLNKGWTVECALTTPVRDKRS